MNSAIINSLGCRKLDRHIGWTEVSKTEHSGQSSSLKLPEPVPVQKGFSILYLKPFESLKGLFQYNPEAGAARVGWPNWSGIVWIAFLSPDGFSESDFLASPETKSGVRRIADLLGVRIDGSLVDSWDGSESSELVDGARLRPVSAEVDV